MKKRFNITGLCVPHKHYMVDLSQRLTKIRKMVAEGNYFTMNRARQYGKTTTLAALAKNLAGHYIVVSLDFQALGGFSFGGENIFAVTFANYFLSKLQQNCQKLPEDMQREMYSLEQAAVQNRDTFSLYHLFLHLTAICKAAPKPIVLMIDEVDSAANNQVFLDFLAQLRSYYLERDSLGTATFHSVILASLYDIKNLKIESCFAGFFACGESRLRYSSSPPQCDSARRASCQIGNPGDFLSDKKLRPHEEHQENSPWNIAVDFNIDMSFSVTDIAGSGSF